jgi:hypothetical protein
MAIICSKRVFDAYDASYFRIDRFNKLDEQARIAEITLSLYPSENVKEKSVHRDAVHVTVRGRAFDAYLAKAALRTGGDDIYAKVYRLLVDYTAAIVAKRDAGVQSYLTEGWVIDIASDYGNQFVFEGGRAA